VQLFRPFRLGSKTLRACADQHLSLNVPIACGGATVIPGDIIVADKDGVVVVSSRNGPETDRRVVEPSRFGGVFEDEASGGRVVAALLSAT